MEILYGCAVILIMMVAYQINQRFFLKPYQRQRSTEDEFCVIDIRDYISAHRSPYPGAENIPLSYLRRTLNERFDCPKKILVVSDDKRGAKMAAKLIRKKQHKPVYYIQSNG
ncbi:rhodanese-like domain-containing protein [Halobacillus sp. H74]|uniref:rhodanese-like domain-containing protein n=1 Tax=Halobacillus sp. H74 TaxID=3457436 RepID=UPI003FCE87E5